VSERPATSCGGATVAYGLSRSFWLTSTAPVVRGYVRPAGTPGS
jgi:hypothetical protein